MNPQIEQQQNIETSTQQLVNKQTSQNINELLPKIQDPQKKKFIWDLKPVLWKVLNTEFWKQATKYLKKRPDGETSLQNVLVWYSKKALWFANFAFRQPVWSPPYNQALWKLKTMLDKHYNNEKIKAKNEKSKAELQEKKQDLQEIKKEKQTIEKTISKEIKQLKAELATLKGIKEKHKITVSEEEIKTAEQKFWMTETELQQKLDNSSDGKRNDYKQAWYTARSLFSFLITKDKLKSAGAEPSEIEEFGNTMNKIQDELDLHEIKQDFDNPEPIETFSHLSTEQSAQIIKQTDGMQQAV